MRILHIDSSPLGDQSASRQLTAATIERLKTVHPNAVVEYLDLIANPIKPLDLESLAFKFGTDATLLTANQREQNKLTQQLLGQLMAADVLVIGAPMYNFSIPVQLKNWIDRIAQAGKTFKYTEQGPVGLVSGKKLYILSTRGGFFSTSKEGQAADHQESFLKTVMSFMGMSDITFVRAEGLEMGSQAWQKSMDTARAEIAALNV